MFYSLMKLLEEWFLTANKQERKERAKKKKQKSLKRKKERKN